MARSIEPGVVATAGPRYFGYVTGGALPATVAADWLTSAGIKCAAFGVLGPSASVVEEIVGYWLKDVFRIPANASFAITTGCQMAHVTALAAARHDVLERHGWDVRERGLAGSPPITVVAGRYRHATLDRALRLLGIGGAQIAVVAADEQARMEPWARCARPCRASQGRRSCARRPARSTPGRTTPSSRSSEIVRETDAWLHVDGAFGLWVAASPSRRHLIAGHDGADSWAADGHKWLNVPYDCGLAFCARPAAHRAAMTARAAYFEGADEWSRDAFDWTPESSRRARAFTVYAALRSLGRRGLAELVDGCCERATQFAGEVSRLPGCTVLNDVVINQVLFRFDDDETTSAVLAHVQASGRPGWVGRAGTGAPRSGSPSRTGARPSRT